jgi:MATE family multidrug resistance protein
VREELRATFRLALPLAIAQLSTYIMGVVDTACVGHFSADALAAVAIGNSIHWGFAALGMGVSLALDPLIAQAVGAKESDTAWNWLRLGARAAVWVGVPLVLLELLVASNLTLIGIDAELSDHILDYCIFRAPAMIMSLLFFVTRSYLQAHEMTRPIVLAALVANLVNLVSDVLLVFGDEGLVSVGLPPIGLEGYGALGVGFTTLMSSIVMVSIAGMYAVRMRPASVGKSAGSGMRTLLQLSIPLGLQQAAEAGMFSITAIAVGRFGAVVSGAHQVALTCAAFAFMCALGISSATAVRVGQAVGAQRVGGVRRAGLAGGILAMSIMSCFAAAFLTIPELFASLLTDQVDVLELGASLLVYAAGFAVFDGLQVAMAGALRGAGDIRVPFLMTMACYWLCGIPMGLYLSFGAGMGVQGLWVGLVTGLVMASFLLGARFAWLVKRPVQRVERQA